MMHQFDSIPRFQQALLAEFLGTFFFVFIIGCCGSASALQPYAVFAPLAIGFGLTSLVYTFGYISKAQLNPAISVGLFVARIQDGKLTIIFVVVQMVAGILGALTARGFTLDSDTFGAPAPYSDSPAAQARTFFGELFFTFLLTWTMINVGVSRQSENSHYGLSIGLVVFVGAIAVGRVSGAAFNPSVTIGLQLVQLIDESTHSRRPISWIWLYWLAQFTGGIIAGLAYHLVEENDLTPENIHTFGRIINAVPNSPKPATPAPPIDAVSIPMASPAGPTNEPTVLPLHETVEMTNKSHATSPAATTPHLAETFSPRQG